MNESRIEEKMHPIYHEIGHWMIANYFGFQGFITGNLEKGNNFFFQQTSELEENIETLEKSLLVGFGGLASESILGIPLNAGGLGDLLISCENLKKIQKIQGKTFDYKNHLNFPKELYEHYLSQSKEILIKLGGKEEILNLGNYVHSELTKKS